MKKEMGFTLAEVLITLVIIGVIAAITVPSIISNTNNEEILSRLKKAYSTLSQATDQIMMEEGPATEWASSGMNIYELYRKKLNLAQDCGTGTGCWPQGRMKNYNGTWTAAEDVDSYENFMKFVLSDGTQIHIDGKPNDVSPNCDKNNQWGRGSNDVCAYITFDVNGIKKPNRMGRDIFQFVIKENGLYPLGCDIDVCGQENTGLSCTCQALMRGDFNY